MHALCACAWCARRRGITDDGVEVEELPNWTAVSSLRFDRAAARMARYFPSYKRALRMTLIVPIVVLFMSITFAVAGACFVLEYGSRAASPALPTHSHHNAQRPPPPFPPLSSE